MKKEKVSGKLPPIKVRSLYHRPTEQHRDEKVYRRKGRQTQRDLAGGNLAGGSLAGGNPVREYRDGSLLWLHQAA